MKKVVFLVSGNGGNLKFLYNYLNLINENEFSISAVIADRECSALEFARTKNLSSFLITYTKDYPHELQKLLNKFTPDIIITTIYKILDTKTVNSYKGKLVNLHYSLLPNFKGVIGVTPIKQAIDAGCRFVGSTTHFVNEEVDGGKIISQSMIPIDSKLSFNELVENVFRSGCLNLLNSLYIVSNLKHSNSKEKHLLLQCDGCLQLFSPELRFKTDFITNEFWQNIKAL